MRGIFRSRVSSWLKELPRFILVALFGYAAIDKLLHFQGFVAAVQSYQLLPDRIEYSTAIFFIIAELAIAIALVTRRWRRQASISAVLLLGLFTTVYLMARPESVCGCWFTLTLNTGGSFNILQNLIFIGLAIITWLDSKSLSSRSGLSSISPPDRHSTVLPQPGDGRLNQVP